MEIMAYLVCLILTWVSVAFSGGIWGDVTWLLAVLSLIAVPMVVVRRLWRADEVASGIVISWSLRDALTGLATVLALFVPVALCNHWVRTEIQGLTFHFAWSNVANVDILSALATQILCVAFPEEFFYRGFLQTAFLRRFRGMKRISRWAPALAIVAASACFALAHLPSGGVFRLLTFFPGLLFGFLRYRTNGLLGAILCHAGCNMMMMILNVHYWG